MPSGVYERKISLQICSCGETNPDKFYLTSRTKCKACVQSRNKIQRGNSAKSCVCGESDPAKFFDSVPHRCRSCHTRITNAWKKAHPEKTSKYRLDSMKKWYHSDLEARRREREAVKHITLPKQKERRKRESVWLQDKFNCDARRLFGTSKIKDDKQKLFILLHLRLFRLVQSHTMSFDDAQRLIGDFDTAPFDTTLKAYRQRSTPNILGVNHINTQQTYRSFNGDLCR